jgi:hypothetical protein
LRLPAAAILLLCLAVAPWAGARAETEVDLELVLAVDSSGSVDAAEFALQVSGIAAAFRDPEVLKAIASGPHGRIAVTVAFWAETDQPKDAMAWAVIDGPAGAADFARRVEHRPRSIPGGGTGIGRGVLFAVRLIEGNAFSAARRVIDVSGDGRESAFHDYSVPSDQARFYALARGVSINGLAILSDDPDLEDYYERRVIAGPDSFALAAGSFADFAEAMRRKLIREIEYRPAVSRLPPPTERTHRSAPRTSASPG